MWCSPFKCGATKFQDIPVEYRLCTMCEENVIETEFPFLLYCNKYNQFRYPFSTNLNGLFTLYHNFDYSGDDFNLIVLLSNE